ncbi:MAG: hypothetical protein MUC79_01015 [Thiobacillaceae bacterium]|jgi:hypothetical protein|nr:hypothetical protein [Thiobacillaceae bacterium]
MRRVLAQTLLAGMPLLGHAFDGMMNPMGMMNPATMINPMGMMSPATMMNPVSMMGPMGMGMAAPMMMGSPMGMGVMHPAMQMAPNMMSYQHINQMSNPYLGGPFAGNPYLKQSLPLPFAPPAFSPSLPFGGQSPYPVVPMFGAAAPGYPSAGPANPFMPAAQAPALPFPMPGFGAPQAAQPAPTFPFALPAAPAAASNAPTPAMPFDPGMWLNQFTRPAGRQ